MSEDEVREEARLIALEYLLVHAHVLLARLLAHVAEISPQRAVEIQRDSARRILDDATIPEIGAALSDAAADEIRAAVERLFGEIEKGVAKIPKAPRRGSES